MKTIVVGVADCRISRDPEACLVTYSLGSCIAVGAYDPGAGAGGVLHFMLPDSQMVPQKVRSSPAACADTGIPLLIERLLACGCEKKKLRIRLAGGAQMLDQDNTFQIGKRNYLAARKMLWKAGLMVETENVGGTKARNLGLVVGTGEFWVQVAGAAGAGNS